VACDRPALIHAELADHDVLVIDRVLRLLAPGAKRLNRPRCRQCERYRVDVLCDLWSMFLKQRLAMLVGFVKPEPLQVLADILSQPGVTPAVDRTLPLEETADAMRALVSGKVRGKLVTRVAA
jgi:hypothetical protein